MLNAFFNIILSRWEIVFDSLWRRCKIHSIWHLWFIFKDNWRLIDDLGLDIRARPFVIGKLRNLRNLSWMHSTRVRTDIINLMGDCLILILLLLVFLLLLLLVLLLLLFLFVLVMVLIMKRR